MVSVLLEVTHYSRREFMIPEVLQTIDYHIPWQICPESYILVLCYVFGGQWQASGDFIFLVHVLSNFLFSALLQGRKFLFLNSLMCRTAVGQAALVLEFKWANGITASVILCLFKHLSLVCLGKQKCMILSLSRLS